MSRMGERDEEKNRVSRRQFLELGGAALAAGSLTMCAGKAAVAEAPATAAASGSMVKKYHRLGRTEFEVSDVSMGCGQINESNVVRYAYDKGINYFDTAESYGNGDSEKKIGESMPHMDRKKIFITTKLQIKDEDTEATILDRFSKCRERLQTDYVDALYIHSAATTDLLENVHFHAVVQRLKTDGHLRFCGVSNHGPRGEEGHSMEQVLSAAADDGRFDLMLLSYNFLNKEEAENVLAAGKKNDVGTTAMKTQPGMLEVPHFDPDNPSEDFADFITSVVEGGGTREEAIERINGWVARQADGIAKVKPFVDKYGITTEDQLTATAIQWALQNPDMHTVTVSAPDYERIDLALSVSGTPLSAENVAFLRDCEKVLGDQYCRHGCTQCVSACAHKLPVNTIMRYAYYAKCQGREKHGMVKYAGLKGRNAGLCRTCSAPCRGACPHGLDVQGQLLRAHSLLSLA